MRPLFIAALVLSAFGLAASESAAVALVPGDVVFTTFSYPNPGDGMVYHVDGVTSDVTLVATGGLLGSHPDGVAVTPDGMIVTSVMSGPVVRIDPETGAQTIVASFPSLDGTIAVDEMGNIYVTGAETIPVVGGSESVLYRIDAVDDTVTEIARGNFWLGGYMGLAIDPNEDFILTRRAQDIVKIDAETGVLTVLLDGAAGEDLLPGHARGVAVDGDGDIFFASLSPSYTLVRYDPLTGLREAVLECPFSGHELCQLYEGIAVGPDDEVVAAVNYLGSIIRYDQATDSYEFMASGGPPVLGFRRGVAVVPAFGPLCNDSHDNDGDGLSDFPEDPGCDSVDDFSERSPDLACDDGVDNDGDGMIDFDPVTFANPGDENSPPAGTGDPACFDPRAAMENPQCQDGINNDPGQDGWIDYDGGASAGVPPEWQTDPDPQCVGTPWKNREARPSSCGLGAELALLLPLMWVWRRRRL